MAKAKAKAKAQVFELLGTTFKIRPILTGPITGKWPASNYSEEREQQYPVVMKRRRAEVKEFLRSGKLPPMPKQALPPSATRWTMKECNRVVLPPMPKVDLDSLIAKNQAISAEESIHAYQYLEAMGITYITYSCKKNERTYKCGCHFDTCLKEPCPRHLPCLSWSAWEHKTNKEKN